MRRHFVPWGLRVIWVDQPGALTIVIEVAPGADDPLQEALCKAGEDGSSVMTGLASIDTIHFARFVFLPGGELPGRDGETVPASLAFESNYDGAEADQLQALVVQLGPALDDLLCHCKGWGEHHQAGRKRVSPTYRSRLSFLEQHIATAVSPYRGHPNISAKLIKNDLLLHAELARFVDDERRAGRLGDDPIAIRDALKRHASTIQHLDTGENSRELPTEAGFYARIGALAVVVVALATVILWKTLGLDGLGVFFAASGSALALAAVVLGVYHAFSAFVRSVENEEKAKADEVRRTMLTESDARMPRIFYAEDQQTQNALTHLVPVKPDWRRHFILRVILWAVRTLAKTLYVQGKLGPIDSIHCARWVRIDRGQRLLFFSNYDGSWESYLGEFVDKLSLWLTAVWSNTHEFPTTTDRFQAGARDEEWFKRWTRKNQLYTHVWYAAYPNTSVQNVNANAALREGLSKNLTDQELRRWLRLL